jgi:hypothetical protein
MGWTSLEAQLVELAGTVLADIEQGKIVEAEVEVTEKILIAVHWDYWDTVVGSLVGQVEESRIVIGREGESGFVHVDIALTAI